MLSVRTVRFVPAFLLVAGGWLLLGDGLPLRLDPDTRVASLVPGRLLLLLAVTGLVLTACAGRGQRSLPVAVPSPSPDPDPAPTRRSDSPEPVAGTCDGGNVGSLLGRCSVAVSVRQRGGVR